MEDITLGGVLNDPGWWHDRLAEELGRETTALARVLHPSTETSLLMNLSQSFAAYDEWLSRLTGLRVNEVDVRAMRVQRTYLGALKKFRPTDKVPKPMADSAILGFLARNNECATAPRVPERYRKLMKERLGRVLGQYDLAVRSQTPRFGPGAVREGYNQVRRWFEIQHSLDEMGLEYTSLERTYASSAASMQASHRWCRLEAVPKDWDKARLITVEPTGPSFCQQLHRAGILCAVASNGGPVGKLSGYMPRPAGYTAVKEDYFEGAVRRSREVVDPRLVPFDMQAYHRKLALEGSLTGALATLDLSDASDRITWAQVCDVFPLGLLHDLEFSRSPTVKVEGEDHEMYMYAGMGNATTFIVETLLFWALCHAVADYHRLGGRFVSVFGDDIVVDARLADTLFQTEAFASLGWVINPKKSMWRPDTRFRESCGIQAFNGQDVTLTRIFGYRNSPKGVLGVADLITRLDQRGYSTLAETVYGQVCNLPNVQGAPRGSASVDLPWLPRTVVPTRYVKTRNVVQLKLKRFEPECDFTYASQAELVWASITGQLHNAKRDTFWRPEFILRRETGDIRGPKTSYWSRPKVSAAFPRRGTLVERWLDAGVELRVEERG